MYTTIIQYILSICTVNIYCQYILSIYTVNIYRQYTLSIYRTALPCIHYFTLHFSLNHVYITLHYITLPQLCQVTLHAFAHTFSHFYFARPHTHSNIKTFYAQLRINITYCTYTLPFPSSPCHSPNPTTHLYPATFPSF